jgi:SAM-dependent methyltransferase
MHLPNLVAERPERYARSVDVSTGQSVLSFRAMQPSDFDWLEEAILKYRYYEKPGVWQLHIDFDKRIAAEIISRFSPTRVLELGCAAGAVIECLTEAGVEAEGVEISRMAIDAASEAARKRIHHGDLLELRLQPNHFDVVFGLDIFEHLNPNRLHAYLNRLGEVTHDGGIVYCNIPAFGNDRVFGTVFPRYLSEWETQRHDRFSTLHCDELGYPLHGHLVCAEADWWVRNFEDAGLQREVQIERALHSVYDDYMARRSPARRAYFVFGKRLAAERRDAIISRISATRSPLLNS